MKVLLVVGQRKETYPGQHAPEVLDATDEITNELNPDFITNSLDTHRANTEFERVEVIEVDVSTIEVMKILRPAHRILSRVVPPVDNVSPDIKKLEDVVDVYLRRTWASAELCKELARDPMVLAATACQWLLDQLPGGLWAETYVELKLAFFRAYARGLICSTEHGTDYFRNVIDFANGSRTWDEKGYYGDNFRKMVKERIIHG
jgi:hypothetical protein